MSELILKLSDFEEVIDSYVPSYQRQDILKVISNGRVNEDELEDLGLTLTGEKSPEGSFIPTGSSNNSNKGDIWGVIKKQTHQYFCTEFDNDNGSVIKDAINEVLTSVLSIVCLAKDLLIAAVTVAVFSVYKIGKNTWCAMNSNKTE